MTRKVSWVGAVFGGLMTLCGPAAAQTLNEYGFDSGATGPYPFGTPVQGRDGNLYGLLSSAGYDTYVYQATQSGVIKYQEVIPGDAPNSFCNTGMILGKDGSFYGTCSLADDGVTDYAFRFTLGPNGTLPGTFTTFATIFTTPKDCNSVGCASSSPNGLVQTSDGNFYGTTFGNNAPGSPSPLGWAFQITPAGVLTVIHKFGGKGSNGAPVDAAQPDSPLIEASNGFLYGVSAEGGNTGQNGGTLYRLEKTNKDKGDHVVYSFPNGDEPDGALVELAANSHFYGTSVLGGANDTGYVFEITEAGAFTDLYDFGPASGGGVYPTHGLTLASDGNFYGIAADCHAGGCGKGGLFQLTPTGGYTSLESFPATECSTTFCLPDAGLLQFTDGSLFSVLQQGYGPPPSHDTGALFQYIASPALASIISLQETRGAPGATVDILGKGFKKATEVRFGPVAASFTIVSDTYLTAIVPKGAVPGQVRVHETPNITLTSVPRYYVQ